MKKLVIALMAFALVITLAGCGGGGGGGSSWSLSRGDDGKWLKENGFEEIYDAYQKINKVFVDNNDNDPKGTTRANAFYELLSEKYSGKDIQHKNDKGEITGTTPMSSRNDVRDRLEYLIQEKKFNGVELIAFQTLDGVDKENKTYVPEKTKLYVKSFQYNGNTYENTSYNEYVFDKIEWVNEGTAEAPVWKIKSGFDNLGKTAKELLNSK